MRILFIEDRPKRQKKFLPHGETDILRIKAIDGLLMPTDEICRNIIVQINQKSYQINPDLKLIIIHKSSLETSGLVYLNEICKKFKITLILFSGGSSQLIYNNEAYEFLNINSTDFYTNKLIPYLENFAADQTHHLLEIAYNNWRLSYLFLARQIIGSLEDESDIDRIQRFRNKLNDIYSTLNFKYESIMQLNIEIQKKLLVI
jgi:hypothetical protein